MTLVALTAHRADEAVYFVICAALVAVLLLSHKLAAQLLLILLTALSFQTGLAEPLIAGALGLGLALLSGLYPRVFRAHLEVLRYWRQHVALRGARPVYDSPLYASRVPPEWQPYRLYAPGLGAAWRLLRGLIARNPWALLALLAIPAGVHTDFGRFVSTWAFVVYLMAMTTLFFPQLRFLGEGFRYLKFAAFPVALLVGRAFSSSNAVPAVAIFLALSGYSIRRLLTLRPLEMMDPALNEAFAFLRSDPRQRVAVLPTHHADAIAWHARKTVLWGGHSSGYERLADLVPVLRRLFADQLDEHGIELFLLNRDYVQAEALALGARWRKVWEHGPYLLYERSPERVTD